MTNILIRGKVLSNLPCGDGPYGSARVLIDYVQLGNVWYTPNFTLGINRDKGIAKIKPILEISYYLSNPDYKQVEGLDPQSKGKVELLVNRDKLYISNKHRSKLDSTTGVLSLFIKVLGSGEAIPLIQPIGNSRLSEGSTTTTISSIDLISKMMAITMLEEQEVNLLQL